MTIHGRTVVLGVFGDPIEHSRSPIMQNEFARETGADTVYVPFRVPPEDLENALHAIPALSIRGVNITVPHKVACMPHLDRLDPAAEAIGAVNTVSNEGGDLIGENTDAAGFLADLRDRYPDRQWERAPAVVLGAGGAARAVTFALAQAGLPRVWVANRTESKAGDLIAELCPEQGESLDLTPDRLNPAVAEAGLVVNTTSLGMAGETIPGLRLKQASPKAIAYDLIYNPPETPFLTEAKELGMRATNGLGMLVRQGAISFERWTRMQPKVHPVIEMLER